MNTMESKTAMLHGRPVSYVAAGAGPALLLIHGMRARMRTGRR